MKITVNVECTPEEARTFFGLPDLQPMQTALIAQLQERLTSGLQTMDADMLMRTWLPTGLPGMEHFTKTIMGQLDAAFGRETRK